MRGGRKITKDLSFCNTTELAQEVIDELRHATRRSRRVLKQEQCAMSVIWDPEA